MAAINRLLEIQAPTVYEPAAQASTNSYADVTGSKIDTAGRKCVSYICTNTGANEIDWKVLGSNDDSAYIEIQAEAGIAAAASGSYGTAAAPYKYYKVQIKAASGGSQGEATLKGYTK